jgi:hypothetical protein
MTFWESLKPHLATFIVTAIGIAMGAGGTIGFNALRPTEAPKVAQAAPAPQTIKAEVSCLAPPSDVQVLEELRLVRNEMERGRNEMEKNRALLGRAAAECRAAGKSPLLEIFK